MTETSTSKGGKHGLPESAVLLVRCQDRRGVVAALAQFLFEHGGNIVHADQHQDAELNLFFSRIEWTLADFDFPIAQFAEHFAPIAKKFEMDWRIAVSSYRQKVAIFVSKADHCLADLLYRQRTGELDCDISMIISNHQDAEPLARFYNIDFQYMDVTKESKAAVEQKQIEMMKQRGIDLVILARYMQIISPQFTAAFADRIINIHHSFLPAFVGARPYHRAYERGVKLIGATSHYVTEVLDEGPIIEQDTIRVSHRDTVEDLVQKGRDLEKIVLSRAVRWHLDNRILLYGNKTVIFD